MKSALPRWHSNVTGVSLAVNANDALIELVEVGGPEVIVVSGGVTSNETVHVREAGVGSVFPDTSVARTSNVCEPLPRPL